MMKKEEIQEVKQGRLGKKKKSQEQVSKENQRKEREKQHAHAGKKHQADGSSTVPGPVNQNPDRLLTHGYKKKETVKRVSPASIANSSTIITYQLSSP